MSLNIFKIKIPPIKYFRSKEEEENNYIDDLPPELLVHIFSFYVDSEGHRKFLKNIPLVCKRWNDIYETPSIWKNVLETEWKGDEIMQLGERGMLTSVRTLNYFNYIGVYCARVTLNMSQPVLAISVYKKCSEDFYDVSRVSQIINFCPNLRQLHLFFNCVSEGLMQTLIEHCPKIEILSLSAILAKSAREPMPEDVLVPFLSLRGRNLKILQLSNVFLRDNDLISTIGQYCHSLEELFFYLVAFMEKDDLNPLPDNFLIRPQMTFNELMTGCPKLRTLHIHHIDIALSEVRRDQSGFENMVDFNAMFVNFNGMDLFSILKNARNLKKLEVMLCQNVLLNSVSRIPSEKLENLTIACEGLDESIVEVFEESVNKWKCTLTSFYFDGLEFDVTPVLETYLHGNPSLRLEVMILPHSDVSIPVLKKLMRTCKKLRYVRWKEEELHGRLEVEEFCLDPAASSYYYNISRTLDNYLFQITIILLCILSLGSAVLYSNR